MPFDDFERRRSSITGFRSGGGSDGRLHTRLLKRIFPGMIFCLSLYVLVHVFYLVRHPYSQNDFSGEDGAWKKLAKTTVLSRKTGYSVLFNRLPIHMIDHPRADIPHEYIYADATLDLGKVHVIDILANLSSSLKSQRLFDGYNRIHDAIRNRVPPENGWGQWDVDRYKFLPLHGDMYRRHPDADWYVSVDGDTYLFWSTLLRFLDHFNPEDQLFFGLANNHGLNGAGNTVWANGGAGYVLSKGVMDMTYAKDPWGFENRWDDTINASPGGDVALARALYNSPGIFLNNSLTGGSPMFTSENAHVLPFTRETWLSPLITLHHLQAFEIHELRTFEKQRLASLGGQDGIKYCDLFFHLAPLFLNNAVSQYQAKVSFDVNLRRKGWTFGASRFVFYPPSFATARGVPYDAELCEALCEGERDCLAWLFTGTSLASSSARCSISKGEFRFGEPSGIMTDITGWRVDRIVQLNEELNCDSIVARKLADWERFQPLQDAVNEKKAAAEARESLGYRYTA